MKSFILSFLLLIPSLIFGQVAIGSLTTTTLSQTGAEKLPISGSGTPGTTLSNISQWVTRGKVIQVAYGAAAGDQAPTIQAAVDAATAGDVLIISGTSFGDAGATGYIKVETAINVSKKLFFIGNFGARLKTSSNITILNLATGAAGSVVFGIQFEGSGEDSGSTSQIGILAADDGLLISNCIGADLGGSFISASAGGSFNPSIVSNCIATNCNIGYSIAGAYKSFNSCTANSCNSGFVVSGGNNSIVNCIATQADNHGIEFNTGTNTGRTRVVGGMFNHNTGYSIYVTSIADPLFFEGVGLLQGAIWVKGAGTNPVFFNGCHLDSNITLDATAQRVVFTSCGITGTVTLSGDVTQVIKANNYDDAGNAW